MPKEVSSNPPLAWIEYDPRANTLAGRKALGTESQQRRIVRSHVAHASSGVRKATIAKKEALRRVQGSKEITKWPNEREKQVQNDIFLLLVSLRYRDATANAGLAMKAVRTLLWKSFTGNHTCFEAALFVSGTFANTCGIPASALHDGYGSGLLFLRGASLEGIQANVMQTPNDSLNSVSIALLAGWERRFGDEKSYEVHMQAWKALPLVSGALDHESIATLADVALECFREASQERALTDIAALTKRSLLDRNGYPPGLPSGFQVIPSDRPEAASLLGLTAKIAHFDPTAPDAVNVFRRYCLENMSWSPSHSVSVEPVEAHESAWDPDVLTTLYHVRSALISINGVLLKASLDAHKIPWTFDLQTGYNIHAESCQHLRSKHLLRTKYGEIIIWAKLSLCAIATRSQSSIDHLDSLMRYSGIENWGQLESLLKRHIYSEQWLAEKYRGLFEALTYQTVHH